MRVEGMPAKRWLVEMAMQSGQARIHFSQLGEDAVLWHIFAEKRDGFYVDVGAFHPFRFSNTALLHRFNGWRGINIDLDQRAIDLFKKHRPNDINVCCAIGEEAGAMRIPIFAEGTVNTLDASRARALVGEREVFEEREVQIRRLDAILAEHLPVGTQIDVLNVDAEGLDEAVLRSNDWSRYAPEVVLVEAHDMRLAEPNSSASYRFMTSLGYRLISHVFVTSIYRRG